METSSKASKAGRQLVALLTASATLVIATLVSASTSTQVEQLSSPLVVPRTAHVATTLADGRILITGGRDSAGNIVAVSEIFDPAAGTSTASATLTTARVNHTATRLSDGRVLVAGGSDGNGSLNSAEIFDPANPAAGFQMVGATMGAARSGHTATLLSDGTVLIAGGDTAGTAEIFDPTGAGGTGTFSPTLLNMAAPRIGHTATLFSSTGGLNGVLFAGGGTDSMEWFDATQQKFTLDSQVLSAAHAAQQAISLSDTRLFFFGGDALNTIEEFNPSADTAPTVDTTMAASSSSSTLLANGNILVLGASMAGLYAPNAADLSTAFTAFDETSVPGSSILLRTGQTATQLSGDKKIFVAGGVNAANLFVNPALFNPARIWTDKDDYQPNDPVVLSGSGWKPNENVYLYAVDSQTQAWTYGSTVAADANGGFVVNPYFIVQLVQDGASFSVSAVGAQSAMQADVKFTDSTLTSVTVGSQTGTATVGTAAAPTYDIAVAFSNSPSTNTVTLGFAWTGTPPTGVSTGFNPPSVTQPGGSGTQHSTLTITTSAATPAGTYTFTVTGTPTSGSTRSNTGTLVVGKTSATVTLGSLSQTYDGTPKSATATTNPSGLNVTFTYNGSSTAPTNAGSYTVVGTINDPSYSGSATGTLVINKATPTVTVTGGTFTYDGTQHAATATAVGVDGHTAVSGSFAFTYTPPGNSTAPTNASATPYTVSAAFTSSNSNYGNASGSGSITINKATPTFKSVHPSQTITQGTASITVNGQLNAGSNVVPTGEMASITVASTPPASTTSSGFAGSQGSFNGMINTSTIAAGTYTITYHYGGDLTNFNAAIDDTSTTLTVTSATTTTAVGSSPNPSTYGQSVTFTATVTSGSGTPTGTVTFYDGACGGTVLAAPTTLVGGTASFSTSSLTAGSHTVTACYSPNSGSFQASNGSVAQSVNKATPTATLDVTNSPVTYNGSGQAATVGITASSVPGTVQNILTGGTATQTNAGTYAVTADFVPNDTTNYNTLTGLSAGNFVIQKATPTATLAVNNSPVTYNGSGQAATVGITASSVPGTVQNILTGGAATQTNAGTYAVTADFVPNDTANYNTLTGLAAGNFVIKKATPTATLAVNNSPVTYNGSGQAATVGITTSSVPGTVANILTGGAATQTNAGTYAVTADFVPNDTTNYETLAGLAAGNFVIKKAVAVVTVSGYTGTYDAMPHGATGSVTGVDAGGAALGTMLNLGATFTNVPGGPAFWTFSGGTNYTDQNGSVAIVIIKANAVITITPYHVTYDTHSHTATGTAKGVDAYGAALGTTLDLSGTTHTNAEDYTADPWTFSGGINYYDASGTVEDIIDKVHLTVTADAKSVQYSDPLPTFTATITGFISPDTVAVVSGSPAFSTTATVVSDNVYSGPGPYTITPSQGTLSATNYDFPASPLGMYFKNGTLTVTQEDARAYYTGDMMVATSSPTSTTATVLLSATIKDITAVPTDSAYDAYPGDIRNALVTFINRDTNTYIVQNLPVTLVNVGDTRIGTVNYNWTNVPIGTYTIGIIVTDYYTDNSSSEDSALQISQLTPGSINGGGYLVMSNSAGSYPGGVGTKNNFGFNVQNAKNGVKGNINTIIRNNGRTYQIKGNSMTSLTTNLVNNPSATNPSTATFNGKANIQDITNPNAQPISIDGNATLQVQLSDAGQPGTSDQIAITVWNKNGGMWFTSNWNGTRTIQQTLGGGNLMVR